MASTYSKSIPVLPRPGWECVHLLLMQDLLPPPVTTANGSGGRSILTPSSPRPLRREQVALHVPARKELRAGGRAASFPDETGLPGHQLPCLKGCSDKEPNLNSCNVAVCNIEYLRHLLKVSHYKWMERIQECFIKWEPLSERHIFQSRILIRHYLYL